MAKANSGTTGFDVVGRPIVTGWGHMASAPALLRPQGLGEWLIWQTTGGRCRIETKSTWVTSGPGELILIAPRVRQHYGTADDTPWVCIWAVFEPRAHWYDLLRWPELSRGIMRLVPPDSATSAALTRTLRRVNELARLGRPRGADWAMNTLERLLLRCERFNARSAADRLDPRVERAVQWLQAQVNQSVSIGECAQAVGCSVAHLRRLFGPAIGCPPMFYHERCRMERAANLLRLTGMTVGEIAAELGFNDPFYFSTRFRHHLGQPPSAHREQTASPHQSAL